jgi:tetratricopeptide (TPR) repeat protein
MDTFASILSGLGGGEEALSLMSQNLDLSQRVLGKKNDRTLIRQNNLGHVLIEMGKFKDAETVLSECFVIRKKVSGMDNGETMGSLNNLSVAIYMQGVKLGEAEKLEREGYEAMIKSHGPTHPHTVHMLHFLARILLDENKLDEAEKDAKEALATRRKIYKDQGHEHIGRSLLLTGRILYAQNRPAEAEKLLREAMVLFRERYPTKTELIGESECWLGACLTARGQFGEAEKLLRPGVEKMKAAPGVPERHKKLAFNHVVKLYEAWDKPDEAAKWRLRRAADE